MSEVHELKGPAAILVSIGIIALIPLAAMLNGYVLATLWVWFIVPVFDLPTLTVPYAIGISMVIGVLTHQDCVTEKKDNWWESLLKIFTQPLAALAFGWIVRMFI